MAPSILLFAQVGGAAGNQSLVLLALVFAVMYFVLIRPSQKQQKEHRALLGSLKKGDEVITQGGIIGKIDSVTDKLVTVEVASGVKLRVLKTSIQGKSGVLDVPAVAPKGTPSKEEK